jgi:thiamine pyrophosphate-dependent acetolactate synthase large subunit-like protein
MKLTGGQIVVETLLKEGVPYIVGIPGHGTLGLSDALAVQAYLARSSGACPRLRLPC